MSARGGRLYPTEQDRDGDITLLFVIIVLSPREWYAGPEQKPCGHVWSIWTRLRSRIRPCGPDQGSRNQGVDSPGLSLVSDSILADTDSSASPEREAPILVQTLPRVETLEGTGPSLFSPGGRQGQDICTYHRHRYPVGRYLALVPTTNRPNASNPE
jgi:hypothetical protein